MNEAKTKKIIVSCTVGAVLLVVILFFVMIYQLIAIGVRNNEINYFNSQIAYYEKMIEDGNNVLEAHRQIEWIVKEARELGYMYIDDRVIAP